MSFCKNCGYLFGSEQDNICGNCGVPRGLGNKFCSNCGSSLIENQAFCSMCGYRNQDSSDVNYKPVFNNQPMTNNNPYDASNAADSTYNQTVNNNVTNTANGQYVDNNSIFNNPTPTAPNYVSPNVTTGQPIVNNNIAPKSKVTAGILGIFFGAFGVHNFYLGFNNKGVTQLILTIVGLLLSCVGVGVFIVMGISIWAFVESIMILVSTNTRDANGNLLQ